MKMSKLITLVAVLALMLVAVVPASAQLGQTDVSSFTIQNIDTVEATVRVQFIKDDGTVVEPTELNADSGGVRKPNPFTLAPGASWEIYVPGIDATQLPTGRYSVVISSSAQVVAIANLVGSGTYTFNGSYSGFSGGATDFFLPAITFNYYGWYSLISVQNVGSAPADVTVTLKCENGSTGTLSVTDLPVNASHHFDLETQVPTGFTAATECNGSATINADQDIVAVDNQSVPGGGNTQSYSGVMSGSTVLYAPALYKAYYGWQGSLNIQKIDAGDTTANVTYSDGGTSKCDLTDAKPACLLYMPTEHFAGGTFAAKITSSNSAVNLVAVVNAATDGTGQAQTYNAVPGGTNTVGIPSVMKLYYGWNTSFTCQNVGTLPTALNLSYSGYGDRNTDTLQPLENIEVRTVEEALLASVPNTLQTGVTVTAVNSAAAVTCVVNFNNAVQMPKAAGDWSMSYNAFNK